MSIVKNLEHIFQLERGKLVLSNMNFPALYIFLGDIIAPMTQLLCWDYISESRFILFEQ